MGSNALLRRAPLSGSSSGRVARGLPAVAVVGLVASLGVASSASAAKQIFRPLNATCGMAVVDPKAEQPTFVLQNDLKNCDTDGLRFKASNVTLDLNGHSISGMPLQKDSTGKVVGGFGEGVGLRLVGNSRVTVTNSKANPSVISDFDAGMVIQGGVNNPASGNVVKNVRFVGNVGNQPFGGGGSCSTPDAGGCEQSDFNDGLALVHADSNTIGPNNVFKGNGSGGVRIDDAATNNTITGNIAEANGGNGIRFLTGATSNLVEKNTSRYNVFSGVAISFESPNNVVRDNTLHRNRSMGVSTSFHAESTMIDHNTITQNGNGGIALGSGQNTVDTNTITNNGRGFAGLAPGVPPTESTAYSTTTRGNGINVGSGTDNFPRVGMVVSNNTVTGSGGNGIRINCISDQDPTNFAIYGCIGGYDTHDQVLNNDARGNLVNVPVASRGTKFKSGVQLAGWYDLLDSTNTDATLTPYDSASSPAADDPNVDNGGTREKNVAPRIPPALPYTGEPLTDCGNNVWKGNQSTTAYPACTTAP